MEEKGRGFIMDIKDNLLTLADGNQMPQEGVGIYKITDQAELTGAVHAAYEAGYGCLTQPKCIKMKPCSGRP